MDEELIREGTFMKKYQSIHNHYCVSAANGVADVKFPTEEEEFVRDVAEQFKDSLIYDPGHPYMGYSVRDPIVNGELTTSAPNCIKGFLDLPGHSCQSGLTLQLFPMVILANQI